MLTVHARAIEACCIKARKLAETQQLFRTEASGKVWQVDRHKDVTDVRRNVHLDLPQTPFKLVFPASPFENDTECYDQLKLKGELSHERLHIRDA